MLVLSRKMGESLMIGDDVKITVLGIKGNQARIGIEAPQAVSVHREEVFNLIKEENVNLIKNGNPVKGVKYLKISPRKNKEHSNEIED